jgi:N2227-like protein
MLTSSPFWNVPQLEPQDPGFFPRFSMCSGDFVEIYGSNKPEINPKLATKCLDCADIKSISEEKEGVNMDENYEQWDCVVTCFFVDTAPVVLGTGHLY